MEKEIFFGKNWNKILRSRSTIILFREVIRRERLGSLSLCKFNYIAHKAHIVKKHSGASIVVGIKWCISTWFPSAHDIFNEAIFLEYMNTLRSDTERRVLSRDRVLHLDTRAKCLFLVSCLGDFNGNRHSQKWDDEGAENSRIQMTSFAQSSNSPNMC